MNKRSIGVAAALISAVTFGFMPLFTTHLAASGGTTLSVSLCRFCLSLIPLSIYLKVKKIPLGLTFRQLKKIFLVTAFGYGLTAILLFFSYNYIPTGMATTLHFCYPAMVIIFSAAFLREKIKPIKLLCVIACMAGLITFYDGGAAANVFGMLLAFASGNTYAFYIIYLDKSELKEIPSLKLIFYMNAIAAVMIFAVCLATDQLILSFTAREWAIAFAFAILVSFVGVLGFQIGVKYTDGQTAAILSTFEPITSVVIGIVVYSESFSVRGFIGIALILSATVLTAISKDGGEQPPAEPETSAGSKTSSEPETHSELSGGERADS